MSEMCFYRVGLGVFALHLMPIDGCGGEGLAHILTCGSVTLCPEFTFLQVGNRSAPQLRRLYERQSQRRIGEETRG